MNITTPNWFSRPTVLAAATPIYIRASHCCCDFGILNSDVCEFCARNEHEFFFSRTYQMI